jgi:hypothetical protein
MEIIEILQGEVFVDVNGFEDFYQVSNMGRILRKVRIITPIKFGKVVRIRFDQKIVVQCIGLKKDSYYLVKFNVDKISTFFKVHRLVAQHFISNPNNKPCVNHKNGVKTDNRVENLEWCTHDENMAHAWATGLFGSRKGSVNANSKLNEENVLEIRSLSHSLSVRQLSEKFKVSQPTIYKILSREKWSHI